MRPLLLALAALSIAPAMTSAPATGPVPTASPEAIERIRWWEDAKFGLFIHWGPVSLAGTEIGWSRKAERRGYWQGGGSVPPDRYDNLYKKFNPVAFDPAEWTAIAKDAGMKYVVLTTRHHDGFSLWDTQANDYKITSSESPYRKDIVKMLADATRAAGLRFGAYYSQPDWLNPDAFTERHANYQAYIFNQVRELMSNYGRVDILWFDGLGKSANDYGAVPMHKMVRELQPQILINNRNGLPEDFDTPEQRVGTMQINRPWESCITICRQWAWMPNDVMKPLDECLRILVSTVTGGGNLLLNVGPMPDGRIEPRQVERLREIGAWLRANGEAIYGTRGGPFRNGTWGGSTYRDNTIYVQLLQAPVGGKVRLPALSHRLVSARFLNADRDVAFAQNDDGITLDLGANGFAGPVTILKLTAEESITPGQALGLKGGAFDDVSLYGTPRQADAIATASTGEVVKETDGRLTVKTNNESKPSLTLDLGAQRELTAFSAVGIEHNAFNSNVDLHLAISSDGEKWEEIYRGSYGLPQWELPITRHVAGIQHPGRPARFLRVWIDYGPGGGSLKIGRVSLFAK